MKRKVHGTKGENPKDVVGALKLPLHLFPPAAIAHGCLAMLDGLLKYGRNNFRKKPIKASGYVAAILRHALAYLEGEDEAQDSGVSHLGHILATAAIMVDAQAAGTFIDDRNFAGQGYLKLLEELQPKVLVLLRKYEDRNPRHFTIKDNHGLKIKRTGRRATPRLRRAPRTRPR